MLIRKPNDLSRAAQQGRETPTWVINLQAKHGMKPGRCWRLSPILDIPMVDMDHDGQVTWTKKP